MHTGLNIRDVLEKTEAVRPSEVLGVTGLCQHPLWVQGTEHQSPTREVFVLNRWVTQPLDKIFLKKQKAVPSFLSNSLGKGQTKQAFSRKLTDNYVPIHLFSSFSLFLIIYDYKHYCITYSFKCLLTHLGQGFYCAVVSTVFLTGTST